ncbi:agamous-like MADS-box protein AGL80 [Macadamia integrifolia]|uniref:agamous-like MADS-box protein AGL80 n=1 Tax=Macadamia integrifolia TaxID=60698 RepID=UPI001C4E3B26|nr:agamous-like MADS-box protein AGL80 [Macadamia integrifolia]
MSRKKVKLELIADEATRRTTFRKRKKGVLKKVSELSTLCGVNAVAIIYGPCDPNPDFWPPSPSDAKAVLTRFKNLSEMEQAKKMMNQQEFLKQRIGKLKEKLKSQMRENQVLETTKLMYDCLAANKDLKDLSLEALGDLVWLTEKRIKEIQNRINDLRRITTTIVGDDDDDGGGGGGGGGEASGKDKTAMEALLSMGIGKPL